MGTVLTQASPLLPVNLGFDRGRQSERNKALALLKSEVVRIGTNGTRTGFKFAEAMFSKYPELRNA